MRRLAILCLIALAVACALVAGRPQPPVARADATGLMLVACENLAPYLDGDAGDITTAEDVQGSCADPIPPTGELSIELLEFGLGGNDARLAPEELAPLDALDGNRIDAGCTYSAVVVQASRPHAGCVLLAFAFVDDQAPVTLDGPATLAAIEAGGASDFVCSNAGLTAGRDDDCPSAVSPPTPNPDGIVVFRLLTAPTAVNGGSATVLARQEDVEQSVEVTFSTSSRVLPDADGDGVVFESDNCPIHANPLQANTDAAPIVTPGFPNDVTRPRSDLLGDACDRDDDNDGLPDDVEPQIGAGGISPPPSIPCPAATGPTLPAVADTDGDRVLDGAECALGSNPVSAVSKPGIPSAVDDADGDGLPTVFENERDFNPLAVDSDGDRIPDGAEFKGYDTSPQNIDSDGDGCGDAREIASLDGNTVVNVIDLSIVAYSLVTGQPYPLADIDRNGAVNIIDIQLVAVSFNGTAC